MPERRNAIRLAAYVATAGTISAAEADIQVYDGPPISVGGSVYLELQGLSFNFGTSRDFDQYFDFHQWSFCCGYSGKYYSYCTNWSGSWISTYRGWEDLSLNCGNDMTLYLGFMGIGAVVEGNLGCSNDRTDLCSFTYYTYSNCGDISYSQTSTCHDTRRFHVGFKVMQDGTEVFGWIELEGPSYDLNITRWAYEDSGAPILVGQVPVQPCVGNLNNDGSVNAADLGLLLSAWGDCPKAGDCAADLNGDWSVDAADLGLLLSFWGDCPDPCDGLDCADDDECTIDACIEGQCYNVVSDFGDDCWPGECCTANGTPGCESSVCEDIVCMNLAYCCETEWDTACAVFAQILGCDCP
ncbi:MAG: hypothetical protein MK085_01130 [Phycisphaerales bacterium]|nr:hypothetical protein [Phycisphaerales bacterium]